MLAFSDNLSIKQKFSLTIFSAVFGVLVIALCLLLIIEWIVFRQHAPEELRGSVASIVEVYSDSALSLTNRAPSESGFRGAEYIRQICIYRQEHLLVDGRSLLRRGEQCPENRQQLDRNAEWTRLVIRTPVRREGETGEEMWIVADLFALFQQRIAVDRWFFFVLFSAVVLTILLPWRLTKIAIHPINNLLDTVRKIGTYRDYSLRAEKTGNDELGLLADTFNAMIATVQAQNKALIEARNRYLLLYDDNPTIIFNVELDGGILSVNKFGARQLIQSNERLQGCSIFHFIHFDDRPLLQELFDHCAFEPLKVHRIEIRMIGQNDSIIWVRGAARVIDSQSGKMNILLVCEDITETRKLSEQIAYQAQHDSLTGLLNRAEFDRQIQQALRSARNSRVEYALCYLDLDQFKIINDTCGHIAGDELLRQLSILIKNQIRQDDLLARLGGDEFGILMKGCLLSQAAITCEKIRNAIQDFHFAWEDRTFSVGVSIGISGINSISGNSVESLKEADAACYAAKEKGRNRVHVFRPDDQELAFRQGEMQWVEKIQQGIAHNRFCLFGQPIVPIGCSDEGLHFETLIRYRDENGQMIPPGAFLPAAERYNLASALDKWVIASLFEWLAKHPGFIDTLSVCSVNLSGLSLSDETMLDYISEQFAQWAVPTNKICFEITETAAISSLSNATRAINTLRERGSLFSLDDFGSGLSSFAYLKNLPVDFLKIDGLFVKDIIEDQVDLAMVRSINEVGHVMGKKTIAEFVENERIFGLLKELGVDYAQGYGIGKPVLLKDLSAIKIDRG
ncbi:MAG: hypothetical protein Kow0065_10290 [Methylomicrobium sp.]